MTHIKYHFQKIKKKKKKILWYDLVLGEVLRTDILP